jgi:cbb3-type cytochrome oxidase maturation protein
VSVLVLLIFTSLAVAIVFLIGFIWAVRSGQYEDTCTPSLRLLAEDAGFQSGRVVGQTHRDVKSGQSPSTKPMNAQSATISAKPDPDASRSLNPL